MSEEREIRLMLIYDPNSADSLEMEQSLNADATIEKIEVQRVRSLLPGVRTTPAIGVILWASDKQGLMENVERFVDYIHDEEGVRKVSKESQAYIPDSVAWDVPRTLYDTWSAESVAYTVGQIVIYGEDIYRCLTAHTSQASWTPEASPSLWVKIADPAEEWPEWVQPAGSTDSYAKGAKVSHNGKHWTSTVDSNVWEPGVYGWDEVTPE